MSDEYEMRRQQRLEDERKYQADVAYDVWRSGGNMDRVDRDRVSDDFRNGVDEFSSAQSEMRRQTRPRHPLEEEQSMEDEE